MLKLGVGYFSVPIYPNRLLAATGSGVLAAVSRAYALIGIAAGGLLGLPVTSAAFTESGGAATMSAAMPVARSSYTESGAAAALVLSGPPTTFDPANKSASITLSGGNLIATSASAPVNGNSVRTIRSQTSGNYFWEITNTTFSGTGVTSVGLVNATFPISTDVYVGQSLTSIGYFDNGTVLFNTGVVATLATFVQGDVIGVAWNAGLKRIWFRVNAGGWNNDVIANQNPATGVGGIDTTGVQTAAIFPAISLSANALAVTASFGATAFANAAPSGFGNF